MPVTDVTDLAPIRRETAQARGDAGRSRRVANPPRAAPFSLTLAVAPGRGGTARLPRPSRATWHGR